MRYLPDLATSNCKEEKRRLDLFGVLVDFSAREKRREVGSEAVLFQSLLVLQEEAVGSCCCCGGEELCLIQSQRMIDLLY